MRHSILYPLCCAIIHADDLGMCHSANLAGERVLAAGAVTSGSIMVPCPAFDEMAAYAVKHPQADLGLHLTFTSEWKTYRWGPVAPRDKVPGLLDPAGFLWHEVEQVAAHASPAEFEAELRAQVAKARAAGVKPTHLDTHMGTCFARPEYIKAYCQVALEEHIPAMIPGPTEANVAMAREMGLQYPRATVEALMAQGMPTLDTLIRGVEGNDLPSRRQAYHQAIRNLKPGITQIIIHPAVMSDELRSITGTAVQRDADYQVMCEPETLALIKAEGIKLVTWRELGKLLRKGEAQ